YNPAQVARVDNTGILLASGLIAGEALMGLIFAALRVFNVFPPEVWPTSPFTISLVVLLAIALILIMIPLRNAGKPDEPAPPSAMM
ncbi:MAG TPA: oligopeptide transporter, OPT family, partial [Bacteroidota bacterium]|nr:oligopeptide transporter, OPT family [Bacteroidota bacterium]